MTDIHIRTKYPPKHLAFRSALWSSMILHVMSHDIEFVPQEHQGNPDDESITMEWWQHNCICGVPYRFKTGPQKKKRRYGPNKKDPNRPVCMKCGNLWPFTKLVLRPKDMAESFEWDTDIHSNSKQMSEVLLKAITKTKNYFDQMFKAHMEMKRMIGP